MDVRGQVEFSQDDHTFVGQIRWGVACDSSLRDLIWNCGTGTIRRNSELVAECFLFLCRFYLATSTRFKGEFPILTHVLLGADSSCQCTDRMGNLEEALVTSIPTERERNRMPRNEVLSSCHRLMCSYVSVRINFDFGAKNF